MMRRGFHFVPALLLGIVVPCAGRAGEDLPVADFTVAPTPAGNDANPGSPEQPFATMDRARLAVRGLIAAGLTHDVTVHLRAGIYRIGGPVVFDLADSAPAGRRITYAAYPGEQPVISGGRVIGGWTRNEDGTWSTSVADVQNGSWDFRELFVNGRRRQRARHPNAGFLEVAEPDPNGGAHPRSSFVVGAGDLPTTSSYGGAELVILHDWSISRVRIAQVDHATRVLTTAEPIGATGLIHSVFQYSDHPRYAIENDPVLLDAAGEWFLDKPTGRLTYRPVPGEIMPVAEVVAPVARELIIARGSFSDGTPVRNLHFVGLTLEHCAWPLPAGGYSDYQAGFYEWRVPVGTYYLPAALTFEVAEGCTFERGRIAHCGGWGLMFGAWCRGCSVSGSVIADIAGNGVMIGEDQYRVIPGVGRWWDTRGEQVAANNAVESNLVQDCGQVFHGAVGVWLGLTDGTRVRHNLIRRLPWTGVSSGTLVDATPSPCGNVLVESNHIHDVLQVLSDGGGIYTLGEQTGSVLRNNRIHGIPINAGLSESNGMFLDQGTTGLMITSNGLFDVVKSLLRFHIAGQNSVIGNTFRVYTTGQQPVRFQNSVPGNVTIADNVVIDPANPPACADPVCDAAIEAGLLPADAAVIFADADSDGMADLEDPCPVDAPDDSDGDFVCDSVDRCPGADDNVDDDGDGVPTACDQCPATPPGAQVAAMGCCVASNCDLDLADYVAFSSCLTGPGAGLRPQCAWTDFDIDGDTDLADFAELAHSIAQSLRGR